LAATSNPAPWLTTLLGGKGLPSHDATVAADPQAR
jgi:hypothetical protein